MRDQTYRVQYVDDEGETAFTKPSFIREAIILAIRMRTGFVVEGIVDDVTGDLYMTANQIRNEARSEREKSGVFNFDPDELLALLD
jgi:hypothetical protein